MLPWLWREFRRWRRRRTPPLVGLGLSPTSGSLTLAACSAAGSELGPVLRTVLRADRFYDGMHDVELRGFLDGRVKFARNVATQYHVRIGCETVAPRKGSLEVMRVLQRWSLACLPEGTRVLDARLVLRQEDTSDFPHFFPLRWPVTYLLYDVKKPWNPGEGGIERDNLSRPAPGDAWWLEAKCGELSWREPGCGFGSDGPDADRGAQPLAWASLRSPRDDLVFSGPRLAAHVEEAAAGSKALNLLIAACAEDELLPGTIRCFYSREYGDDLHPALRPRLELQWQAPVLWSERRPFLLEPGASCIIRPGASARQPQSAVLCASFEPPARDAGAEGFPSPQANGVPASLAAEVYAVNWRAAAGEPPASDPRGHSLALPLRGTPEKDFEVRLTTAIHPVAAGDDLVVRQLHTWKPSVERPEDLALRFTFTAPSGREFSLMARHAGDHIYECRFAPDELGVWSYSWRTRPDARFREQQGGGHFTCVRASGGSQLAGLRNLAASALLDARAARGSYARRQSAYRLTALGREIRGVLAEELSRGAPAAVVHDLEELLEEVGKGIPRPR